MNRIFNRGAAAARLLIHRGILLLGLLVVVAAQPAAGQASKITGAAVDFQNGDIESALKLAREGLANGTSLKDKDIAKANSIILRALIKTYEGASKEKDSAARAAKLAKHPTLVQDAYQAYDQLKANDPKNTFKSEIAPYLPLLGQIMVIEAQKNIAARPARPKEGIDLLDKADRVFTEADLPNYTLHLLKGYAYLNLESRADSMKAMESFEKAIKSHEEAIARLEKEKAGNPNKQQQYDIFKNDKSLGNAYAALVTLYAKLKGDINLATQTAEKGKAKYPENEDLVAAELNIYLDPKLLNEALKKFKEQADKTPDNIQIVLIYANLLEKKAKALQQAGKPEAEVTAAFDEAIAAYKRVLAKDPKNRDANFNVGAIYVNRAVDVNKLMNALPNDAPDSEYEALKAKKLPALQQALPHLEAAAQAEKFTEQLTLVTLVSVTAELGDMDKMNQYKAKLDALQK